MADEQNDIARFEAVITLKRKGHAFFGFTVDLPISDDDLVQAIKLAGNSMGNTLPLSAIMRLLQGGE